MIDIKFWYEAGISAASVVGGAIIGWYAMRKLIYKVKDEWCQISQEKEMISDKNIGEELNELRHDSDACRTKLFQYHNGTSFASGNSMKKMAMTHESCNPGMTPTYKGNTDQVLSLFVEMSEILAKDKPTLTVVNGMVDSYFKSYLQSNHILVFSMLPINNTKGGQIGFILTEWCAWSFIDKIEEARFFEKFGATRNSIQYHLSTERT